MTSDSDASVAVEVDDDRPDRQLKRATISPAA
jgi:hypothetical protein